MFNSSDSVKQSSQGVYIVFEGVEGGGKTSQARILAERLRREFPQREIVLTREPGGSFISDKIRTLLLTPFPDEEAMEPITEMYLFGGARAESLRKVVKPALERGAVVIADRSFVASLVYQGFARGIGLETIWEMNKMAVGNILPHKVFIFDLPVEKGLERRLGNGKLDRLEQEEFEFHQKVREGYLLLAEINPERFIVIDASSSIETVHEVIWEIARPLLINDEVSEELSGEFRVRRERE